MVDVSVVIVNYKLKEKAINCLKSIYEADYGNYQFEVILVDNDSNDGIKKEVKDRFPQVNFIQTGANLGMGKGNNIGLKKASGEYLLILNPDIIVQKDSIKKMCDRFKRDKNVGMLGPKLLYPDGDHQDSCFRFPEILTPVYRRTPLGKFFLNNIDKFLMREYNMNTEVEADWLMGSCLLTSRSVLDEVGMFDDRFFMYFEDTDLCRRIKEVGLKVLYYPDVSIYHYHGRGSAENSWYLAPFNNKLARIHIESWAKYFWKWKFK